MSKQRYVIMREQVFKWEDKTPFMASGHSVFGAIEYDKDAGKIRCHECGDWFKGISQHLAKCSAITGAEYRSRHGLRAQASLLSPECHRRRVEIAKSRNHLGDHLGASVHQLRAFRRSNKRGSMAEDQNIKGHCPLQVLSAIAEKAAEIGRTPSATMLGRGLTLAAVARYGSWRKACEAAGLPPNESTAGPAFSMSTLREALIDFYVLNGRLPRMREFGDGRLPSRKPFIRHFGSLRAAYEAAGLGKVAQEKVA